MDRHYEHVRRPAFDADLDEKQWVILLSDPATDEIRGFSTQVVLHTEAEGRPIRALFSGDTIVDRAHWGDPTLAHVWGRLALSLIDAAAEEEFYWFLISKGYKTYRFLPLFFREFYPRHDAATPDGASAFSTPWRGASSGRATTPPRAWSAPGRARTGCGPTWPRSLRSGCATPTFPSSSAATPATPAATNSAASRL